MDKFAPKTINPEELVKKLTPELLIKIQYEAMLLRKKPEDVVMSCGYLFSLENSITEIEQDSTPEIPGDYYHSFA